MAPKDFFSKLQSNLGDKRETQNTVQNNYTESEMEENQIEDLGETNVPEVNNMDMGNIEEVDGSDDIDNLLEDEDDTEKDSDSAATLAAMTLSRKNAAVAKPQSQKKSSPADGRLTVDVYETPKDIVIKSAVAGVKPNEMNISITPEAVNITGKRHHEETVSSDSYFYQECFWGSFSRSIILPTEIDPDNAKASLSKGVLTIRLPKLSRVEERTLRIEEN